ncbi:unnamed protein product [Ectocarpus sp. CCAP 1310/34]|nr:unnamed protein product [Ectocarpus sp. CCAP 1310/34]
MMMRAMHTSSRAPALFARGFGLDQYPACCGGSHFLFGSSESSISRRNTSSRRRQHLHSSCSHSSSSHSSSRSCSSSNSSSNRRTRTTPVLGALMSTRAEGASEDVAALGSRKEGSRPVEGMVRSISPSAAAAFQQCPQLFYYRYILGLKSPPTRETLKGIAVHEVLSLFFTLEEGSRDIGHLHELFRKVMIGLIAQDKEDPSRGYGKLFENQEEEKKWVVECLDLVANFASVESDARNEGEGDPEHVELRMTHEFGGGETAAGRHIEEEDGAGGQAGDGVAASNTASSMNVTGIVDRLDRCPDGTLRVVDYKTGKIPNLRYSKATNQRIMDEKFFQLQIYALLVERVLGEVPGEMRLVYLKGPASVTRKIEPAALPSVEGELRSIWDEIAGSVRRDSFPPRTSRLCDWCSFQDRCPAFEER